ncbi:hypothetical protein AB0L95_41840, partial [Streptomyces sp. NPDC052036]
MERRPRARLELSGRTWEVLAQAGQLADLGFTDAAEQTLLRAFYTYALPEGGAYDLIAELHTGRGADADARRSIDELAEWGQRASNALLTAIGIRRHLPRWRRTPSPATIGRVLEAVDGDALDRAVGAYLADRHHAATEPAQVPPPSTSGRPRVIAVDGKALKGSARLA